MNKNPELDNYKKEVVERLLAIIEHYGMSRADFCRATNILPSSLSHVLNGKGNGGYLFFQSIIDAFPDINARWLMTGKGSMLTETESKIITGTDITDQRLSELSEENNKLNKQIRYLIQFIQLNNNSNEKNFSISI